MMLRRRDALGLALLPALTGCGWWRLRKYGLQADSRFRGGWVRPADPTWPPFQLDKIFWVERAQLADRLWRPHGDGGGNGRYHAAFCSLLDSVTSGQQRYLVAYRHYLERCCDSVAVYTFYALIGVRGGEPDPARSIVAIQGGQVPHDHYRPRRISAGPGPTTPLVIDAGPPVEDGGRAVPVTFRIEGPIDRGFHLRDYHAHADDMHRHNGERPVRHPCPRPSP